jgi:hypothetical protein
MLKFNPIQQPGDIVIEPLIRHICQTQYVRSAIAEQADLYLFKQRPTRRVMWGLVAIAVSYVIGWPAVAALGLIAAWLKAPLVLGIGGPATYALSHLVFILGAWLAGGQYARAFFRWATRTAVVKLVGASGKAP